MIEIAAYYYFIFWFIVLLFTVDKFDTIYRCQNYMILYKRDNYIPLIAFIAFLIIFLGFRPISGYYFGDTSNYAASYKMLQVYGAFDAEGSTELGGDWLFNYVMKSCAPIMPVSCFFVIVIFFYIVMMYMGCRKLDNWHGTTLMLFCLGAFSFYSYAVNGIRNGVACSFVIMAIAGVCKGERIMPIALSIIAISCHKSTALPLACMFFTFFVRNPKYMYAVWLGAIFASLLFGDAITSVLSLVSYDERLTSLNMSGEEMSELLEIEVSNSFRWDFLLYSSMPILLGAYTLFVRKIYNNTYLILLGTYIYANAFWILVIRDIFSNRYAYLSWFLYPIVLAYPLLNLPVFEKDHSQKAALILLAHFGFTTIMWMLGK